MKSKSIVASLEPVARVGVGDGCTEKDDGEYQYDHVQHSVLLAAKTLSEAAMARSANDFTSTLPEPYAFRRDVRMGVDGV